MIRKNTDKMENQKMFSQYTWILRVLTSCENEEQIQTSEKLFKNFLGNWERTLSTSTKSIFVKEFETDKKIHLNKILKKSKTFTKVGKKTIE